MKDSSETSSLNGAAAAGDSDLAAHAQRIESLERDAKDREAKYVYLYAEFENYKKRVQRERDDLLKFGWESLAREMLQILDNLERAISHCPTELSASPGSANANWLAGLGLIAQQFESTFAKFGVKRVAATGQPFNPEFHEAVGQEPSDLPEGSVVHEKLAGFTLHGRLLRPARVTVSGGKAPPPSQ